MKEAKPKRSDEAAAILNCVKEYLDQKQDYAEGKELLEVVWSSGFSQDLWKSPMMIAHLVGRLGASFGIYHSKKTIKNGGRTIYYTDQNRIFDVCLGISRNKKKNNNAQNFINLLCLKFKCSRYDISDALGLKYHKFCKIYNGLQPFSGELKNQIKQLYQLDNIEQDLLYCI